MTTLLVGFDSAWTRTNSGALVGVLHRDDGTFDELGPPRIVDYSQAQRVILKWQAEQLPTSTIVLLDQCYPYGVELAAATAVAAVLKCSAGTSSSERASLIGTNPSCLRCIVSDCGGSHAQELLHPSPHTLGQSNKSRKLDDQINDWMFPQAVPPRRSTDGDGGGGYREREDHRGCVDPEVPRPHVIQAGDGITDRNQLASLTLHGSLSHPRRRKVSRLMSTADFVLPDFCGPDRRRMKRSIGPVAATGGGLAGRWFAVVWFSV